ncbi:GCN5-related N-acetyltransferase [Ferrimonas balearica DSM 9799]|uniref:GCN5-related N-acetyltransferase n=1 Tax=Ferrimonas balearica (strain DSM 9799 / CCM 4581 / KCTC 23876 / PAT) TaxID=550540 RepID=E1SL45_FERBD|nr:putative beta-lysine N-acetyltransferase [Ferrimonas balearica]ADN75423.1 GCN5-related N-acetyltransferase [Ferrimonas balearica DSM 9799]MBY5979079.1 putative beta-lysine N-acetyltransferase [Ferrimonas balearica]
MNSLLASLTDSPQAGFQFDQVLHHAGATLQHGPNNDRVYLMSLGQADPHEVLCEVHHLADQHGYGKIFAKLPHTQAEPFLNQGYRVEARIPDFYPDADAVFLGHYPEPERAQVAEPEALHTTLQQATLDLKPDGRSRHDPAIRLMHEADVDKMAALYRQVFPSYPFPITDRDFLLETMADNVAYFGVEKDGALLALASAEQCHQSGTVEMTDFATAPAARGQGWAQRLLAQMELAMEAQGHRVAYTIARAVSVGMNRTFARRQYQMAGRLVNNTQISGQIESMNVWYKPLRPASNGG